MITKRVHEYSTAISRPHCMRDGSHRLCALWHGRYETDVAEHRIVPFRDADDNGGVRYMVKFDYKE